MKEAAKMSRAQLLRRCKLQAMVGVQEAEEFNGPSTGGPDATAGRGGFLEPGAGELARVLVEFVKGPIARRCGIKGRRTLRNLDLSRADLLCKMGHSMFHVANHSARVPKTLALRRSGGACRFVVHKRAGIGISLARLRKVQVLS